eukprot:5393127-Lingulodinium_polyedra.AAC.1
MESPVASDAEEGDKDQLAKSPAKGSSSCNVEQGQEDAASGQEEVEVQKDVGKANTKGSGDLQPLPGGHKALLQKLQENKKKNPGQQPVKTKVTENLGKGNTGLWEAIEEVSKPSGKQDLKGLPAGGEEPDFQAPVG